jgi:S-adenosylmethionine hydrolase
MSNLTAGHVIEAQEVGKWPHARIRIAGHTINRLVGSYDEGLRGELSGLINSNGVLEVFMKEDSAAQWLKVGRGMEIIVA